MEHFYIICPLGLEKIVKNELEHKYSLFFPNTYEVGPIENGGFEVKIKKEEGFLLNKILKSPSRILWRIKTQKCRDLPKFYNIIKKLPWKDYSNKEEINCSISTKESRLFHTGKLEKSFDKATKDYFQANKISQKIKLLHEDAPIQTAYLRIYQDNLTISLDTSGELLYKRSESKVKVKAPIRENIAAALVFKMSKLAKKEINLCDPMCGSGTFLFEAQGFYSLNQRSFLYEYFPLKQLNEIQTLTPPEIKLPFQKFFGSDLNVDGHNSEEIIFSKQDAFKPQDVPDAPLMIISNPPYGKRIKLSAHPKEYFNNLVFTYKNQYKAKFLGLIIPQTFMRHLKVRPLEKINFTQNGIKVCFCVYCF